MHKTGLLPLCAKCDVLLERRLVACGSTRPIMQSGTRCTAAVHMML